jgi:hypothetical protein
VADNPLPHTPHIKLACGRLGRLTFTIIEQIREALGVLPVYAHCGQRGASPQKLGSPPVFRTRLFLGLAVGSVAGEHV